MAIDEEQTPQPQQYYAVYLERILLNDDNKTLKEYNIKNNEILKLFVTLKLFIQMPTAFFSTIYKDTSGYIEDLQMDAIEIYNKRHNCGYKYEDVTLYYDNIRLEPGARLSTYNIYNLATLRA